MNPQAPKEKERNGRAWKLGAMTIALVATISVVVATKQFVLTGINVAEAVPLVKWLPRGWTPTSKIVPVKSPAVEAEGFRTPNPSGTAFTVGDQLKITFFELLDVGDGAGASAPEDPGNLKTFYQRMDLSADYSIQPDGSISLPRLGTFSLAGRDIQDVQTDLAAAFEREMGRAANVSIVVIDRPPIYVVGPVRNPGSFKYVPGMIVLQAIALAGGADSRIHNASEVVDGIREIERFHKTHEKLQRLMIRRARLIAERDNQPLVSPPEHLLALVDADRARALLEEETALRDAADSDRQLKAQSLEAAVASARNELKALTDRLSQFADQISLRNERLKNLQVLSESGAVVRKDIIAMKSDIADIDGHRQEVLVSIAQAEQKVGETERARAKLTSDYENDLKTEIVKIEQEIEEAQRTLVASGSIVGVMARVVKSPTSDVPAHVNNYEIVRRNINGQTEILAGEDTTDLRPGDVLRLEPKAPRMPVTSSVGQ